MPELHVNILKSFAYMSVLIELSKGKKLSGYDLLLHLKNFGFEVSPGTLYHQLGMLSKEGVIVGHKQSTKTLYEMTEHGMTVFKRFKEIWKQPLEYVNQNLR